MNHRNVFRIEEVDAFNEIKKFTMNRKCGGGLAY
tara:strand:+ start:657 stop:758 length:102 start_codon:yes stop_codon:yes gene_type:complete